MTQEEKEAVFDKEFLPEIDALYNFAFHLTYNETDANDLVQEAYLKAFRFIKSYNQGTNAKAWLFRILKNSFINEYRKKVKKGNHLDISEPMVSAEVGKVTKTDLREDIFFGEMGDEVTFALNNIPVDFKTIILLSDIEEFKYEEIAEILEIPIGTVRSRLHRARNLLKEKLGTYALQMGYEDKR